MFCRVLALAPDDVAALSNRGYAHRKLGQFQKAANDYAAALKLSPGTVRLHNNHGYCLAKMGKYKAAIDDYNKVLELDAANCHAFHNRYALQALCKALCVAHSTRLTSQSNYGLCRVDIIKRLLRGVVYFKHMHG